MKSLWNEKVAAKFLDDPLALRVYSSRLLGQEPALVLHGGGNTSVKLTRNNLFGEPEELLYVKGSGWDLATIETAGFAPVRIATLKKMAQLPQLSDIDMVREQRTAMLDPGAPNPSVEAILHAIIPFRYVDHTHADAIVTISNTVDGKQRIHKIYGDKVLIIPYVMPGFILAKEIFRQTQNIDWQQPDGIILLNHGVFTFSDSAEESYEKMLMLVTKAEKYLKAQNTAIKPAPTEAKTDLLKLAAIRKKICEVRETAMLAKMDKSSQALHFANLKNVKSLATRGPLTPDHVIRTKPTPVVFNTDPVADIDNYVDEYTDYFNSHVKDQDLVCLNPAPCWAVWPQYGLISFGRSDNEARIISDIKNHTIRAIQIAEKLGGWQALPKEDIFALEYWELEQAKLKSKKIPKSLQGKVALVTGAAGGIGMACAKALHAAGAAVVALDINPEVANIFSHNDILGLKCDVTNPEAIANALQAVILQFGGLDILVSNAGIFPASMTIEDMNPDAWDKSLNINLSSHQRLLHACTPYLKLGIDPTVIMLASKNVPAPGPGAAAYSVAKAGQTQLARVAALELGTHGIRVNIIHPNAVFDTEIWSTEILTKRAKHYNLSIAEYKTNNILRTEITSQDVANLVCAMVGPVFAKTTGAQVPIDGGNERVI